MLLETTKKLFINSCNFKGEVISVLINLSLLFLFFKQYPGNKCITKLFRTSLLVLQA